MHALFLKHLRVLRSMQTMAPAKPSTKAGEEVQDESCRTHMETCVLKLRAHPKLSDMRYECVKIRRLRLGNLFVHDVDERSQELKTCSRPEQTMLCRETCRTSSRLPQMLPPSATGVHTQC